MNDTICQVQTQYYENYGDAQNPNWKAKGGFIFKIMVDADDFCYAEEECVLAIKDLLKAQSNQHERFEYISHELIFHAPVELKGFEEKLSAIIDEKYANQ